MLCRFTESQEHRDAETIVEYLMDCKNGATTATQSELAAELGWFKRTNKDGMSGLPSVIDRARFHRALNHVRDRNDEDGNPCCGYRLHYRTSGRESVLALIDPNGGRFELAIPAQAQLYGFIQQCKNAARVRERQIETFDAIARQSMNSGDQEGAKLFMRASLEVEEHQIITPSTMVEIELWLSSIAKS